MSAAYAPICPRCQHLIPNDATPGAFPGAVSRTPGHREICSACGLDEAFEQLRGQLAPESSWPVQVAPDRYLASLPGFLEQLPDASAS